MTLKLLVRTHSHKYFLQQWFRVYLCFEEPQEHACFCVIGYNKISLTVPIVSKAEKSSALASPLCLIYIYYFLFHAPFSHCYSYIDKLLLWYLCHIFNMDMGMIIKSIVAKSVRSALNNGWARMRLNLWGRTERQGKCSHRPLRPSPSLSPSLERHYSGRSFLPSLDIIQCNHPSIKNLLVIKGTTRVNTQNIEKDDLLGDSV